MSDPIYPSCPDCGFLFSIIDSNKRFHICPNTKGDVEGRNINEGIKID